MEKSSSVINSTNVALVSVNGKKYKPHGILSGKVEGAYVNSGYTTASVKHIYDTSPKKICFMTKPEETIFITISPKFANKNTYPFLVETSDDPLAVSMGAYNKMKIRGKLCK